MELLKNYISALTNLYGLVHKDKVLEIFNRQNHEKVTSEQVDVYLVNEGVAIPDTFVYPNGDYFVHEAIASLNDFEEMLSQKDDKPYHIPSQDELLNYVDDLYFEKSAAYQRLYKYVADHFFPNNDEKVKDVCEQAFDNCHGDFGLQYTLNDMVRMGVKLSDEKQMGELVELISDLNNNVRLWENNGHTPREIFEMYEKQHLSLLPEKSFDDRDTNVVDFKTRKKVGRNDPCPCESGKKYKKCCLGKEV